MKNDNEPCNILDQSIDIFCKIFDRLLSTDTLLLTKKRNYWVEHKGIIFNILCNDDVETGTRIEHLFVRMIERYYVVIPPPSSFIILTVVFVYSCTIIITMLNIYIYLC